MRLVKPSCALCLACLPVAGFEGADDGADEGSRRGWGLAGVASGVERGPALVDVGAPDRGLEPDAELAAAEIVDLPDERAAGVARC